MADNRTPESRSALMARIGSKNTAPELIVRRLLHSLGYRFRLHRRDLPGTPDIVLSGRRKAILVHGCYWHGHGCKIGKPPKTRLAFWTPKLARTKQRDAEVETALRAAGWDVAIIWQCETKDHDSLAKKLTTFLGPSKKTIDKRS